MSTHMPEFVIFQLLQHFVLSKLSTSSIKVKMNLQLQIAKQCLMLYDDFFLLLRTRSLQSPCLRNQSSLMAKS